MAERGWHPDPNDPSRLRYWDGESWTDDVAPAPVAPPRSAPSKAPWIVGALIAVPVALVVLAVVAIMAIRFLGTSARTQLSAVGQEVGGMQTSEDPGPFTVVMQPVQSIESTPCQAGAVLAADGSACLRLDSSSVPLKGAAKAVAQDGQWIVDVTLAPQTAVAVDRLAASCYPTPTATCPTGSVAIVRIGTRSVVMTAPRMNSTSFGGHVQISGLDEREARQLAALVSAQR